MKETTKLELEGLKIHKSLNSRQKTIFSEEAQSFLLELVVQFTKRIENLLEMREKRQEAIVQGEMPHFLNETKAIRESEWKVAELPRDLLNRKVEITGPVDRKMIINGLNSGAMVFMADFEDSCSPTWFNIVEGQVNLFDAVRKTIEFTRPDDGKKYTLHPNPAVLMVRPRGLHLKEEGITYDGNPIPASLVDFGLYFYHNTRELLKNGSGPYFYLPKLQHYTEARLWNDIFIFAQDYLDLPRGTIKATVLIEHILASFQMDEILYELREHSAGLNCGRWDYIFSFIKTFSTKQEFVLPDRDQITMDRHFMDSYVQHLISTCHRRGVHAMGGMAAQIPIKDDELANQLALEKVRQDKLREVRAGHDGTWVAHPGLIPVALRAFEEHLKEDNQLSVQQDPEIEVEDLLRVPEGTVTKAGVLTNIRVGVQYLANWLAGNGCVPINNLMEDAATAEISRSQLWQWVHHQVPMKSGEIITKEIIREMIQEEGQHMKSELEEDLNGTCIDLAIRLFTDLTSREELAEFLTLEAYQYLAMEENSE